jgi:hypothetical protein
MHMKAVHYNEKDHECEICGECFGHKTCAFYTHEHNLFEAEIT